MLKIWTGTIDGDFQNAGNWDDGIAVVNGDDLFFGFSNAVSVDTNLDNSTLHLNSITVDHTFSGYLGTLTEYLTFYSASDYVHIGEYYGTSSPVGSNRIKLEFKVATKVVVFQTATSSAETNLPPVRLLFDQPSSGNELYIRQGDVGVACEAGESSSLGKLDIARDATGLCQVGDDVAISEITKWGGNLRSKSGATTINHHRGDMLIEGTDVIGTLYHTGGYSILNSLGDIDSIMLEGGLVDLTKSDEARAVNAIELSKSAILRYDPDVVAVGSLTFANNLEISTKPV